MSSTNRDRTAETAFGSGFIGDVRTGPANEADTNHPTSLCVDPQGRIVIPAEIRRELGHKRVRIAASVSDLNGILQWQVGGT
jgi:hypothetical protein